ncbi:MAG: HD domain-containing protein [Labilibaculum sp.]|nr:HD domain-containing protein [Labilibaculum sp.]MBI9057069.1 HD domain-containing protein [Labilibaculum sp.]
MREEVYNNIEAWFENYVAGFESEIEEIGTNIELKKNHSFRVSELITELSEEWELDEADLILARIAGLLHDLGRFEQLIKYGTFSDTEQNNHIQLGISTLEENNLLSELSDEESKIVIDSIQNHNETLLPKSISPTSLPFVKLVRDADKIDILHIVANYYSNNKQGSNKRLEMELSDKHDISKKVFQSIINEKVVDYKDVMTLNDLKLQQMSLIFDLNSKKSFKIISEKTYLKQIFETMPKKDEVIDTYRQMKIFLENQL